jgi:EmrB/QacA subfamily drug resistance transporter
MKRNRWIGLVFISMAISLVIIDGTIVNTIFPAVIADLELTSTQIQWVQESYVLVFASLLLVWGSLADRIGRRRLLMIGITIFIAASVWAGFAESADAMILARIVQGFGGAMVLPTTLSLVNANFEGRERGIAFAIWGSTIGGMVAIGPVLGGWLATDFDWRWAFNINAPLGILILVGLALFVAESKVPQREGGIDYVGALISVVMFSTLVFGLIEGRVYGWWDASDKNVFSIGDFAWPTDGISIIPVALAISAVSTVLFVIWERAREKANKNVLLDLGLFKVASFRNGSIAAMIISMGEFGLLFAIPLWLQNVGGLSAVSSGLVLLWLAGGAFLASGVGGALSGKISAAAQVRAGVVLELLGVLGIAVFAPTDGGWGAVAPFLLLYGIGVGLATAQLTGVIMVDVPPAKIGQASGSQSTVRQIGSALGIAVLGTALFTSVQSIGETKLEQTGYVQSIAAEQREGLVQEVSTVVVESAGGALPKLGEVTGGLGFKYGATAPISEAQAAEIVTAGNEAFTQGVHITGYFAAGFLLLGLLSTFSLGGGSASRRQLKDASPAKTASTEN